MSLVAGSPSTSLQIVETNQFKNLMHLRLEMRAGNDAAIKRYLAAELAKTKSGTPQFTCFTGAKVHILTRRNALLKRDALKGARHTDPVYLLYWYKSTNTDAEEGAARARRAQRRAGAAYGRRSQGVRGC